MNAAPAATMNTGGGVRKTESD